MSTKPAPADAASPSSETRRFRNLKQARILIVDDEPLNIDVVQGYLQMDGYQNIQFTAHAIEALPLIGTFSPDLVLLDIHMPDISGLEILKAIRADHQYSAIPVVILTASSTNETKLAVLECGATDLLSKPVHQAELMARIRNVLTVKAYQDRLCSYSEELENAVRQRTADLEASRLEVIHCLARAAEFRDDDTGRHIVRVGRYARIVGAGLGLSAERLDILEPAAQLHDVGKIGIPDAVLLKPGKLNREEFRVMQQHCAFGKRIVEGHPDDEVELVRRHTEVGAQIVGVGHSPILKMATQIALTHHERWDGTGYPLGLAGEDIPLEGRITAVADVFDALSSRRAYKPAYPVETCFQIIESGRGTHFDPAVVDALLSRRDDVIAVQSSLADMA
jgi:putative two-component system response regulator